MTIRRSWMTLNTPSNIIKEDKYNYDYPEDLEELLDPDGLFVRETPEGYKLIITSYYHESDTVVYFCAKEDNNEI